MALPAVQAIMNCLKLVLVAPAAIAAASANTGTGLLRNKITCVGVSDILAFNDVKRWIVNSELRFCSGYSFSPLQRLAGKNDMLINGAVAIDIKLIHIKNLVAAM